MVLHSRSRGYSVPDNVSVVCGGYDLRQMNDAGYILG